MSQLFGLETEYQELAHHVCLQQCVLMMFAHNVHCIVHFTFFTHVIISF